MNKVNFRLSIHKPHTHYCYIEIKFNHHGDKQKLSLPVWTPGSYLIREYSRNISCVECLSQSGDGIEIVKLDKNTWEFSAPIGEITISYRVYCNETTVRSCVINDQRAFINGSNLFMRVEDFEDFRHYVEFIYPDEWEKLSTGLYHETGNIYYHNNYDDFIDCPIEIGNQHIEEFDVNRVKHTISIQGKGNYDPLKIATEFKSIVEYQTKFFGGIPYDFYVFLIDLQESGYGGLEHKNSFAAIFPRWELSDEAQYRKFLGLVSHEYFHLWNVKRIRPVELGPFEYDKENYTESHWVTEGWTSFYDNLFLYRSGLIDENDYLKMINREINEVMHYNGRHEMSLADSSFDNWIKFYRRNENTRNEQISYYTKGALVATMLNIEIIKSSNGKNSLDTVLLELWNDYKNNPAVGYTQHRVKELSENAAGISLNDFWNNFVYGTTELPLEDYLNLAGYKLILTNEDKISLDVTLTESGDNIILNEVHKGGTAYESGLQHGDEILAIDGMRTTKKNLDKILTAFKQNDNVKFIVNRNGFITSHDVKIIPPLPEYEVQQNENISEEQKSIRDNWLNG